VLDFEGQDSAWEDFDELDSRVLDSEFGYKEEVLVDIRYGGKGTEETLLWSRPKWM